MVSGKTTKQKQNKSRMLTGEDEKAAGLAECSSRNEEQWAMQE